MAEGFLNILKPPGMTSHDVVGYIRKIFCTKQVGHAGTLDPGAAGVLPVAVGKATRLVEYLSVAQKSYRLDLLFGFSTDTGDVGGEVLEHLAEFCVPGKDVIEKKLQEFVGDIMQRPPAYSALKIQGKRAYALAREKHDVKLPARRVKIYGLHFIEQCGSRVLLDMICSKGTYVRSFCQDFGTSIGIPATMGFLLRKKVGRFSLQDSFTLEETAKVKETALLPLDAAIAHLPRCEIASHRIKPFCNGLSTGNIRPLPTENILRVYGEGNFIGIGRYDMEKHELYPTKIFRETRN